MNFRPRHWERNQLTAAKGIINLSDAARPPADFWIYEDYLNLADEAARAGTDGNVDPFIVATDCDPGKLRDRYHQDVWQPVPTKRETSHAADWPLS